jgi:hypothetical protein
VAPTIREFATNASTHVKYSRFYAYFGSYVPSTEGSFKGGTQHRDFAPALACIRKWSLGTRRQDFI